MSNDAVVVGGLVVGFFLIPTVAGAAPEIVNGLLLLILLGALLLNKDRWLPFVTQFGNAVSQPPPTATGGGGGGAKPT